VAEVSTTLSPRALNRALLARQWLLDGPPAGATALDAIEHLAGLQAQDVKAPYFQLRARLPDFDPEELSTLLAERAAVRIVLMRGTIHLVSARDARLLRALVQPVIERLTDNNWSLPESVDRAALAAAGRALVDAEPRTFAQLCALLGERWPEADPKALGPQIRARARTRRWRTGSGTTRRCRSPTSMPWSCATSPRSARPGRTTSRSGRATPTPRRPSRGCARGWPSSPTRRGTSSSTSRTRRARPATRPSPRAWSARSTT
jgi:hypothetical protein